MRSVPSIKEKEFRKYLFIGGAPKCGTTSLFRYLSDHPEVCSAKRKETYFFAQEFDLKKVCTDTDKLEDFEKYFSHCISIGNLRIEATPYTLYATDAAKQISTLLPNSSMLFILRDPIKRLMSDYRFHIQRQHPSTRGTLEEFLEWQFYMQGDIPNLIKMGCYIDYLHQFCDEFDSNKVHVLIFEDFIVNPLDEMQELCNRLGIDKAFYRNYFFGVHNPTINFRSAWLNQKTMNFEPLVAKIRDSVSNYPSLNKVFKQLLNNVKIIYWKLNDQRLQQLERFPPDVRTYLLEYYRPYNDALSELLGRSLPWEHNLDLFSSKE